jgi:hypothetical protein
MSSSEEHGRFFAISEGWRVWRRSLTWTQTRVSSGQKYFFLFEDETGLLEIINLMSN